MDILNLLETKNELTVERIKEFELLLNSEAVVKNTTTVEIPPAIAFKYKYDFYSLLSQYFNLPPQTFYFFLRINNLKHPIEYDGRRVIKILDSDAFNNFVEMLRQKESMQ